MDQIPELDAPEAERLLSAGAATFVDVRDPGSYEEAHIPGAVHLHDGNVEDFAASAERARPLVVYCYHGYSSLGGAAFFLDQGFTEVYSLRGGFEGWRGGHPVESGPPARG